ncbi:glycoside hydrolase family 55 protein [Xylariaceae sp. FL1272]|nr:glycoside hydrolase family 55 protein [Xylariaceae sp. FL1272]
MRFSSFLSAVATLAVGINAYWLEDVTHQGVAPFAGDGYAVFRNVKDFGAVGDGTTDDTAAIQAALDAGDNRCLQGCASTTTTPAVVYFPAGTYLLSGSLIPPYFTHFIGDPTNVPTLKASANFAGFGVVDANHYYTDVLNWVSVNVFFMSMRNFVIDSTAVAPATAFTGIHWPVSQATSLNNIVFNMPTDASTVHVGLFTESGSGGFMSNLVFNGGATGAALGNQQYTMRNITFNNAQTAIITLWDWGWTYAGLTINNCGVGIDMTAGNSSSIQTGSVTVIDSTISNTPVGIKTIYTADSLPATAGSLILENVVLDGVSDAAVQGADGTLLAGGSSTIAAWGQGNQYTPTASALDGTFDANTRPAALTGDDGKYLAISKPQFEGLAASDIVSARASGAKGDATTDDTAALQDAINTAASGGKLLFIDYGVYIITNTLSIPDGAKIMGEGFPMLLASGATFSDMSAPKPLLQVGAASGDVGTVQLVDFVVGVQGAAPGVTLIEWNLASSGTPSGLWDVHSRVGGHTGSNLQVAQCPTAPGNAAVNDACIGAFMLFHATEKSGNLYMENTWFWVADHDIEDSTNTQVTIFSGRGVYIESTVGTFWMYGTAAEHNELYNYQFANTKNIFASMFQSETPYYQPSPLSPTPFSVVASLNDPDFATTCSGVEGNCAESWGLRIVDSTDFFIYGAGHYSFFNNYDSTTCPTFAGGNNCQARMVNIENSSNINIFSLNTIGSTAMVNVDGEDIALASDNENVFASNIILLRI